MSIFSQNRGTSKRLRVGGVVATIAAAAALVVAGAGPASAHVGGGNVAIDWSIPGAPAEGVPEIRFPMTVSPDAARVYGVYYAQQFVITNNPDGGYTGLQPRPDVDGVQRLRAVFSSFIAGSRSTDPNCSDGADGGAGVSCGVEFDAVYGHTYDLVVSKAADGSWIGTAVDTVDASEVHIGRWTVPGDGLLTTTFRGFAEYYAGVISCGEAPRMDVIYGGPTAPGGLTGVSTSGGEYSDCVGQANFTATTVGNGVRITRGTVAAPSASGPLQSAASTSDTGECVDVPGSDFKDGVKPALWSCHGGGNQRWSLTAGGQLIAGDICLDVDAASPAAGSEVFLMNCSGSARQRWQFADGAIQHVDSGLCLQPVGAVTAIGTTFELAVCDGTATQNWRLGGSSSVASARQSAIPTLEPGATGNVKVSVTAGDTAVSSRVVLTAPTGTVFTGRAQYSNGASGATFDGVLSADGKTLELSLDMIADPTFADSLSPFATLTYSAVLQADASLALRGPVADGSWRAAGSSGVLEYVADGAQFTADVPVMHPLGLAGLGVGALLYAFLALRRARMV
ncbi:RICIN domain-containing protein [Leifsonia poae]|uniref:RICIN domain-containing protein n=1 Tax=Leifsonia poae TaxID=110933 RepID=UPI003D68AA8F